MSLHLHEETLGYEMILDSHKILEESDGFEELIGANTEIHAVEDTKLDQRTRATLSSTPDSSIQLDQQTQDRQLSAADDWSELRAPKVDLKPLPSGLRYAFLGPNSTYPIIVNDMLNDDELNLLLIELRKYRKAIGYSLDDIKGISPSLCTHRIHLENESYASIEPQRRLNPNLISF